MRPPNIYQAFTRKTWRFPHVPGKCRQAGRQAGTDRQTDRQREGHGLAREQMDARTQDRQLWEGRKDRRSDVCDVDLSIIPF